MARRLRPDPAKQELPEFPPNQIVGEERWYVDHEKITNGQITVVDYLVRDGVVTDERRVRALGESQVAALYRSGQTKTFSQWMNHISSLAQ